MERGDHRKGDRGLKFKYCYNGDDIGPEQSNNARNRVLPKRAIIQSNGPVSWDWFRACQENNQKM